MPVGQPIYSFLSWPFHAVKISIIVQPLDMYEGFELSRLPISQRSSRRDLESRRMPSLSERRQGDIAWVFFLWLLVPMAAFSMSHVKFGPVTPKVTSDRLGGSSKRQPCGMGRWVHGVTQPGRDVGADV